MIRRHVWLMSFLVFPLFSFCQEAHKIVPGETLSALARRYHTTVGDIMRLNGMHADSKLRIGEMVKIPPPSAGAPKPAQKEEATVKKAAPKAAPKSGPKPAKPQPTPEQDQPRPADTTPSQQPPPQEQPPVQPIAVPATGYFTAEFGSRDASPETQNGPGMVFRSPSGRADGKFYVLISGPVPGAIVKIVNPANKRIVYAKVLADLAAFGKAENRQGLLCRISDAAADALGIDPATPRFDLEVVYYKP